MTAAIVDRVSFSFVTSRELVKRIDQWRREQTQIPSRSAAVRQLVEIGLTSSRAVNELRPRTQPTENVQ